MKSKFQNQQEKEDFNIWLNEIYITERSINKKRKFLIIKTGDNLEKREKIKIYSEKFNNWINERIEEYKKINLLK